MSCQAMSKVLTVGELKKVLEYCEDNLPVYAFSLDSEESYPVEIVDPTIADRIELNFYNSASEVIHE